MSINHFPWQKLYDGHKENHHFLCSDFSGRKKLCKVTNNLLYYARYNSYGKNDCF